MWIPSCCGSNNSDIKSKLRNTASLYYQKLSTNTSNGVQRNIYSGNLVLSKRCAIKDRSLISQDTAINSGIYETASAKELVFEYFDITGIQFNEVEVLGARFKVLASNKISSTTIDGTKFFSSDTRPFISILIGLKKL